MEKPKNDFTNPYAQGNCTICGGSNFERGRLAGQVGYYPGTSMWSFTPKVVKARRCLQCNHLVPFVDEELSRQQNQMVFAIIAGMMMITFGVMAIALMMR